MRNEIDCLRNRTSRTLLTALSTPILISVNRSLLTANSCHGPLPLDAIGKKELAFGPHSAQDLEALGDADLLRSVKCPPGYTRNGNLGPHAPAPRTPQPQPCEPGAARTRNPGPRLERGIPQPQPRQQGDRLKGPPFVGLLLALGPQGPSNKPHLADPEASPGRDPALGG